LKYVQITIDIHNFPYKKEVFEKNENSEKLSITALISNVAEMGLGMPEKMLYFSSNVN